MSKIDKEIAYREHKAATHQDNAHRAQSALDALRANRTPAREEVLSRYVSLPENPDECALLCIQEEMRGLSDTIGHVLDQVFPDSGPSLKGPNNDTAFDELADLREALDRAVSSNAFMRAYRSLAAYENERLDKAARQRKKIRTLQANAPAKGR